MVSLRFLGNAVRTDCRLTQSWSDLFQSRLQETLSTHVYSVCACVCMLIVYAYVCTMCVYVCAGVVCMCIPCACVLYMCICVCHTYVSYVCVLCVCLCICVCVVHVHVVLRRIFKRQDEEMRQVKGVALNGTVRKGSVNRYSWVWGRGSVVKACFITSGFVSSHLGQSWDQCLKADGSIGLRLG